MPYGVDYLDSIDKILGTGTSKKVMSQCTQCHGKTEQQAYDAKDIHGNKLYLGGVCPACVDAKLILYDGNVFSQNNQLY